jgi:menaquinone-dependent protoporphyrinogen IX oxidase
VGYLLKIWIIHDSNYGNGKRLAETLGKTLEKKGTVNISHRKDISPEKVAADSPDAIVFGTAVRKFVIGFGSKSWIRKFKSELKKTNKTVKYGICFITHAMPVKMIDNRGNRLISFVKKNELVENVFPEWLTGRVAKAEGPFRDGVLETIEQKGKEIINWMK